MYNTTEMKITKCIVSVKNLVLVQLLTYPKNWWESILEYKFNSFWKKYYCNDPKFSDTQNICCNHSKSLNYVALP